MLESDDVCASSYKHIFRWRGCSRARMRDGKSLLVSRRTNPSRGDSSDRRARRHGGPRAEAPFPRCGGRRRSRRRRRSAENQGHRARRPSRTSSRGTGGATGVRKGSQGAMPEMSTRVVLRSRVPEGGEKIGNLRVRLKMERAGATTSIDAAERGDTRVSGSRRFSPTTILIHATRLGAIT